MAVAGDDLVGRFTDGGRAWHLAVNPERPWHAASQRAKSGLRAAVDLTVGFHQMNGLLEAFARHFRKLFHDPRRLERCVLDQLAGGLLPAVDPAPAELTIPVEHQQRFLGWPGDSRDD